MALPYIAKERVVDLSGNDIICRNVLSSGTIGGSGFKYTTTNGTAPLSSTTAALTYTAAQLLAGIIVHSTAGGNGTFDTAANIVAAINSTSSGANVGDVINTYVVNGGAGAIQFVAGAGGAFDANQGATARTVPTLTSRDVYIRLTNVTPGSEAYVVYC